MILGVNSIIAFIIGLIALYILAKVLVVPVRIISKLIINGIVGGITLIIINLIGGIIGVSIAITPVTALIVGFLGLPGVLILLIIQAIA